MLVRQDTASLLAGHPFLNQVHIWQKKAGKYRHLLKLAGSVRRARYSHVINVHRFASSGFLTWFSGAKVKVGFDKNPFAFCYTAKFPHLISGPEEALPLHETERNQSLITAFTDAIPAFPRLYPSDKDKASIRHFQEKPYICIAPASVWFTKQLPAKKWVELIQTIPPDTDIYLLGGKGDAALANEILSQSNSRKIRNLCGSLSFLQSAALMQGAAMNYVNDSAPLHISSAMNAPVTAMFCSTVPRFGFWPLSDDSSIREVIKLPCKPCGLHGFQKCPEGHFRCALEIDFSGETDRRFPA